MDASCKKGWEIEWKDNDGCNLFFLMHCASSRPQIFVDKQITGYEKVWPHIHIQVDYI
jgi:hypothetical protein